MEALSIKEFMHQERKTTDGEKERVRYGLHWDTNEKSNVYDNVFRSIFGIVIVQKVEQETKKEMRGKGDNKAVCNWSLKYKNELHVKGDRDFENWVVVRGAGNEDFVRGKDLLKN